MMNVKICEPVQHVAKLYKSKPYLLVPMGIVNSSLTFKNTNKNKGHTMGSEHKKALLVIFSLLFALLTAGMVFIVVEIQHLGIAGILVVAAIILAMDIRWVLNNKNTESPF